LTITHKNETILVEIKENLMRTAKARLARIKARKEIFRKMQKSA
jgi:hypothetical protein